MSELLSCLEVQVLGVQVQGELAQLHGVNAVLDNFLRSAVFRALLKSGNRKETQ